jgi:hypothetical protein
VRTGRFLERTFSTPLCRDCRRYVRELMEEADPRDSYFDLSVESRGAMDSYDVYVVRSLISEEEGSIRKRLLCPVCCGEAASLLNASGAALSELELDIDRYGGADGPQMAILVRPIRSLGSLPRRKPVQSCGSPQGLWWHTSSN